MASKSKVTSKVAKDYKSMVDAKVPTYGLLDSWIAAHSTQLARVTPIVVQSKRFS